MTKLYKYCDSGGCGILDECVLRLPFIGDLNDPYDCAPTFFFENDFKRIKSRALKALQRKGMEVPKNFESYIRKEMKKGSIRRDFLKGAIEYYEKAKFEDCLICATANPTNFLMWSHYSEKHAGLMIEIDFNKILTNRMGITMHPVLYSHERPKLDMLTDPDDHYSWRQQLENSISVKAIDWHYENEYRTIFGKEALEKCEMVGSTFKKVINGKERWYLRINPNCIQSVTVGCNATDALLSRIVALKAKSRFKHLKIYQVRLSEANYQLQSKKIG